MDDKSGMKAEENGGRAKSTTAVVASSTACDFAVCHLFVSYCMSGQRLIPTRDHLTAVVEETESFLEYLRDAGLIEGDETPPIPESSIAYRKSNAAYKWSEWERVMNPSNTFFGVPPTGVVAGGWPDWQALHYILVDLHALRSELITLWGLTAIVGAKSVKFSYEAIGVPGGGEKAIFITGENGASTGTPVRLEKPLDWPPPVGLEWPKQCRYAMDRIKQMMNVEGTRSAQPSIDHEAQSPDETEVG